MKQTKRQPRRQSHPFRRRIITLSTLALLLLIGLSGFVYYQYKTQHTVSREDVTGDSKYKNITSTTKKESSSVYTLTVEYPNTGNQKIDQTARAAIDQDVSDYRGSFDAKGSVPATPFVFHGSYQVPFMNDAYLSLVVTDMYDVHGAHPAQLSHFWTFDRKTGETISTSQLFKNNKGSEALLAAVRAAVKSYDANKGGVLTDADVAETVTADAIADFVVMDANDIGFEFASGSVAPESDGVISVKIPAKTLISELKPELAKSLFDVELPVAEQPTAAHDADCPAKCVALTFDDGPGRYTEQLLTTLSQNHAHATFFTLGPNVAANPSTVKHAIELGNEVGNHTWSHAQLSTLSDAQVMLEIERTNNALVAATGVKPTLLRPPYGDANARVYADAQKEGLAAIQWSVDTRDWQDRNSDIVCTRAVSGARPGAIILMHDIHPTTVNAIPCVIKSISALGYKMVTIHQLLGDTQPGKVYFSAK